MNFPGLQNILCKNNTKEPSFTRKMNKKIKLAVVSFTYNYPTGRRDIKIIEELSKNKNIKIDLITVSYWENYKDNKLKQLETENLKIHFLKPIFLSKISRQFRYYMKGLFRKLKMINPDIIYVANEPLALNTFLATIYAKILKKKIMCLTWEILLIKKILPIRLYEKFVLRNTDRILVGSRDAKKILITKKYPSKKIHIMPETGIDTSFFKKQQKNLCKKLKIQKEKTCLFVGRLEYEKGMQYILDAKKMLDKKSKRYNYLFVGTGKWFNKLKELSKTDSKIRLLPWVGYQELPKIYNSATLFLYPSIPTKFWEEQFGFSIVEAMACGLPVIASDMAGPREIIKNNVDGRIIKSENAIELSDKVELLMENKKMRKKFSENAIKNVKRFDNKKITEKLKHIVYDLYAE